MRKNKKHTLLLGIVILFLGLGIGFAYLNTTLNIAGTTEVESSNWNVYLNNIQVTTGSVSGAKVTQAPTLNSARNSIAYQIRLSEPGDFYEFTVDAVNDGSLNAMIETVTKTVNNGTALPAYLNYSVTYNDGYAVSANQILASNSSEKLKVRIEYRTDVDPDDLPESAQTLSLSFGVTYIQADANAVSPRNFTAYSISTTSVEIGQALPTGVNFFNNYQDALDEWDQPIFLMHTVENGLVTENKIGFVKGGNVYYLGANFSDQYSSNKTLLNSIFGSSNCSEHPGQGWYDYECTDGTLNVQMRNITQNNVWTSNWGTRCNISDTWANCNH